MRKQVYISADYSETDGDKDVVDGKCKIIRRIVLP